MLIDRIKDDLKNAMKSGASARAGVLRLIISEINNKQKEKYGAANTPLTDEEATAVLQKESKKRKDAIELFNKGNRDDLVKKDEAELEIIHEYLPKALSEEEVGAVIDALIAKGAGGDYNTLIRESMKALKGKADGKMVGEIIKGRLGKS